MSISMNSYSIAANNNRGRLLSSKSNLRGGGLAPLGTAEAQVEHIPHRIRSNTYRIG